LAGGGLLAEERGHAQELSPVDQRVRVAMDSNPLALRPVEHLGHAQIPAALRPWRVRGELHGAPLDERKPREVPTDATVEELDRA
jgi:hypothetical protein